MLAKQKIHLAIEDPEKFYGLQFHPEVEHSEGNEIIAFLNGFVAVRVIGIWVILNLH